MIDNINIVIENENPLFNRREIEGVISASVAPKRTDVAEAPSKKFSSPVENIEVETIEGRFGSSEFLIVARIYKSKEDREATELRSKKQRDASKKPAETPVQEIKPEENKA
jgi:ribosomal protein S24E